VKSKREGEKKSKRERKRERVRERERERERERLNVDRIVSTKKLTMRIGINSC
jgi:hypothetical protein